MKYCSGSAANRSGVGPLMPGILARYRRPMPRRMDDAEWRAFVSEGTRTGKLATTRHDGRPHVVPIWFVLDGDDFVFTTGEHSIKGRALARTGLAALCVDDERPPYAFVSVTGTVGISRDADELLPLGHGDRRALHGRRPRRGVRPAQRGRWRAARPTARRPRLRPSRHRGVRMTAFHIAQLNIGRARGAVDGPVMAEFMALLDPVNAVADASPGFVWRLQTDDGNATALRPYEDDRMIVNMSVWESIEDLAAFVYRSGHVDVMRRRREWFEPMKPYMVLWWVPAGQLPTVEEAKERLAHLRDHGPTPFAFTFNARFPSTGAAPDSASPPLAESCPATG